MTDYTKLYHGISKVAWGYFFIHFDINIGSVSIIPSFIGFILFLSAINDLVEEERDLELLRTLGILLGIWHGAEWIASWFAIDLDGGSQFIDIIVCLVNLYFHFQLLTNLASIAEKYQPKGMEQDEKLLRYRTIQTIMHTVIMGLLLLSPWLAEIWAYISFIMMIIYLVVGICLMKALFALRRCMIV